jgi:hypothetical protein
MLFLFVHKHFQLIIDLDVFTHDTVFIVARPFVKIASCNGFLSPGVRTWKQKFLCSCMNVRIYL